MSLTATQVKNVKNTGSVQKISDGGGLYLYVSNKGSKLWRMNYRMNGKQTTVFWVVVKNTVFPTTSGILMKINRIEGRTDRLRWQLTERRTDQFEGEPV